jgi:hypothetical protein
MPCQSRGYSKRGVIPLQRAVRNTKLYEVLHGGLSEVTLYLPFEFEGQLNLVKRNKASWSPNPAVCHAIASVPRSTTCPYLATCITNTFCFARNTHLTTLGLP